jgi:hypothetical protein
VGRIDDKPTKGRAVTIQDMMTCVTHPAFRLGFLDAQHGRPLDHDAIMDRIETETPPNALKRLGFKTHPTSLFDERDPKDNRTSLAQYRYEEGRRIVFEVGLKCKAWGHPDYPPAQVMDYIRKRAAGVIGGIDD